MDLQLLTPHGAFLFAGTQPGLPGPWERCWGVWRRLVSAERLGVAPREGGSDRLGAILVGMVGLARGSPREVGLDAFIWGQNLRFQNVTRSAVGAIDLLLEIPAQ